MDYRRIAAASTTAMIVFSLYGFLVHGILIARDYVPYEGVYRSGEAATSHTPFALVGVFIAILIFSIVYARTCGARGGSAGAFLGLLFGIFMAGAFAGVNYGTLQIGGKLALEVAASESIDWSLVGIVVGLIYKQASGTTISRGKGREARKCRP
jgi:hypothetical protein